MLEHFSKKILGTVQFGIPYGLGELSRKVISESQVFSILDKAWELGIDTLDTSPEYGLSESRISKYLINNPNKKFNIISKVYLNENKHAIKNTLEFWLKKCPFRKIKNCKTLNLLIHSEKSLEHDSIIEEVETFCFKHHLNCWGVSIYTKKYINKIVKTSNCKIIQMPFSVLNQSMLKNQSIIKLKRADKIIHARSIFTQGLIFKSPNFFKNKNREMKTILSFLENVAKEKKCQLSNLALQFVLHFKNINNVIIGIDNINQLKELFKYQSFVLDEEIISKIVELTDTLPYNVVRPERWN